MTGPGASFVPPAERIATFDNDGTLWCEKPQYVQAEFVLRRWQAMVQANPGKAKEQPYKALVEKDRAWLANLLDHVPELVKGVTDAYGGITVGAFEQAVQQFFATATHPTLGLPYTKVGYQPMRERPRVGGVIGAEGMARRSVERGHERDLHTVLGEVQVTRLAYRAVGSENLYTADAQLNLPASRHSHGIRRLAALEAPRGSLEDAQAAIVRQSGQQIGTVSSES